MSNLAALQAQIAELQSNLRGGNTTPINTLNNTTPAIPTVSDIRNMVKEALGVELEEIRKLIDANIPKTETKKKMSVLEAIGTSLTPEEQTWLSAIKVQEYLPDFLLGKAGSDCVKLFVSELKEAYENKT